MINICCHLSSYVFFFVKAHVAVNQDQLLVQKKEPTSV